MIAVAPATLDDLAALAGARTVADWRTAKALWRAGQIYAVRAGDELLALGFLIPIGDGQAEGGFNFAPRAAEHMLGLVRALQLTLQTAPYPVIVTECGTPAGKRIARLAGFHPSGVDGKAGEIWAYGPSDRRERAQAAAAAAAAAGAECRTDRRQPAPVAGADGSGAGTA